MSTERPGVGLSSIVVWRCSPGSQTQPVWTCKPKENVTAPCCTATIQRKMKESLHPASTAADTTNAMTKVIILSCTWLYFHYITLLLLLLPLLLPLLLLLLLPLLLLLLLPYTVLTHSAITVGRISMIFGFRNRENYSLFSPIKTFTKKNIFTKKNFLI